MPAPVAERPPKGLNAYWLGVWRHALKTLKAQGSWAWEQRPLLDEYVEALRAAEAARAGFGWLEHLEDAVAREEVDFVMLRQVASGLPTQWDRHVKRAQSLADQLALTPRGRKAVGLAESEEPEGTAADPLAALDELATRRRAKHPA